MPRDPGVRWDVPTAEALRHLVIQPLPLNLRSEPPVRSFHRDLYVDTTDGALKGRQTTCWLRLHLDGRRELFLLLPNGGTELRLLRADAAR